MTSEQNLSRPQTHFETPSLRPRRMKRGGIRTRSLSTRHALEQLSDEIWTTIFDFCRQDWDDGVMDFRLCYLSNTTLQLGRLAQVCRTWKAIIFGCERLWSDVYFSIDFTWEQSAHLRNVLGLCGSKIPLNVSMELSFRADNRNKWRDYIHRNTYPPVFHVLLKTAHRWRTVRLRVEGYGPDLTVNRWDRWFTRGNSWVPQPLVELRHLTLSCDLKHSLYCKAKTQADGDSFTTQRTLLAPNLRSVKFEDCCYPVSISLPWKQLNNIQFDGLFSMNHCQLVVAKTCRLLQLEIAFSTTTLSMPEDNGETELVNHYLESLHVICLGEETDRSSLPLFFDRLRLPRLKQLSISGIHGFASGQGTGWCTKEFGGFLRRSPSLEALELRCDNMTDYSLIKLFRDNNEQLKGLKRLVLKRLPAEKGGARSQSRPILITDELLRRMNPRNPFQSESCLLPRLEHLEMEGGNFDLNIFVDMVQARWDVDSVPATTRYLRSVVLYLDHPGSYGIMPKLEEDSALRRLDILEDEGLDVIVYEHEEDEVEVDTENLPLVNMVCY